MNGQLQINQSQLTLNFSPPKLSQQGLYRKFLAERKNKQLIAILDLLKDCKPHTCLEISRHAKTLSVNRRLSDLREFGFNISHALKGEKHFWYIWFAEGQTITDEKTGQDIFNAERDLTNIF